VWGLTRAMTRYTAKHDIPSLVLLQLLGLVPESELQRGIRDIIDELDIMLYIVKQQQEIIGHFKTNAEGILTSERNKKENRGREDQEGLEPEYDPFKKRAKGILDGVCWQVRELDSLKASAVSTAQNVSITNNCNKEIINEIQVDELISLSPQTAGGCGSSISSH
jgi:hypothetical protein